ncbi:UNVERIFIED_CONTAM: hypothetical protein NCL1_27740 [Trichonephila clavipes]
MHALYSSYCQIPVLIRRFNLGAICAVTSTHITIILESLPKPADDTVGDSKFLGYFQLGTFTFQSSNNSTTPNLANSTYIIRHNLESDGSV